MDPAAHALRIVPLRARYAAGSLTPSDVVRTILARDAAVADPAIWTHKPDERALLARAAELEVMPDAERETLPLWGIPFVAKDNIDLAGVPTTAACPAFAYTPGESATVVQRLLDAGAICVGKANLDQFATGLVGVRSPFGTPRNPYGAAYVPGGSSSGSAVSVAQGLACFSLGTDTAGSGRVPAGFCNLVGLKPSRGLVSTTGVVPACRSLDCVSVFAHTPEDARIVLDAAAGEDAADPYSRADDPQWLPDWPGLRVGVPVDPVFFDDDYADLFTAAVERAELLGGVIVPVDISPFLDAGKLLYGGAWIAERYAAVGAFIDAHPSQVNDIVAALIAPSKAIGAVAVFEGQYKLERLRKETAAVWSSVDVLLLPTAPAIPSLADLRADPLEPNFRNGTYTTFVNLLDLAAIALPAGFRADGLPFGISLVGPVQTDRSLLDLAEGWTDIVELAVVGAHLEGEPLHHELGGAPLLRRTRTAPTYRLFALDTVPAKPGLVRAHAGEAIEVEVYALGAEQFGRFVAKVPAPLTIGTVLLEDGTSVKGFLCEPAALESATEITGMRGWRAYRAAL